MRSKKRTKTKTTTTAMIAGFFCVRLKSHAYVRDVSRSSNLCVFLRARERVGKKKKRVKNLTFLQFNKDEEEEKREKSSVCAF